MTCRPPEGPSLKNPHGLHVEHIGTPLAGTRHTYQRAWRGQQLVGRVVNRTHYPTDGPAGEPSFEAQAWTGDDYEDGPRFGAFFDALEFLT